MTVIDVRRPPKSPDGRFSLLHETTTQAAPLQARPHDEHAEIADPTPAFLQLNRADQVLALKTKQNQCIRFRHHTGQTSRVDTLTLQYIRFGGPSHGAGFAAIG